MSELVTVRFGDAAFLVPRAIADTCARLQAAGNGYAAMTLARDHHAGAPNIIPSGTTIRVPLAFADALPDRFRKGLQEMSSAAYTNLHDANAELERLRAELETAKAVNVALLGNAPPAAPNGRVVLDNAALNAIRDDALRATLVDEAARRTGPAGQAAQRLSNAWKVGGA